MGFEEMMKIKLPTGKPSAKKKPKLEAQKKTKQKPKLTCKHCGKARWTTQRGLDNHHDDCPENPKNKQPAFDTMEFEIVKNDITSLTDQMKQIDGKLNAVQNNVQIIQDNSHITKLVDLIATKMDNDAGFENRIEHLEEKIKNNGNDLKTVESGSNELVEYKDTLMQSIVEWRKSTNNKIGMVVKYIESLSWGHKKYQQYGFQSPAETRAEIYKLLNDIKDDIIAFVLQ